MKKKRKKKKDLLFQITVLTDKIYKKRKYSKAMDDWNGNKCAVTTNE